VSIYKPCDIRGKAATELTPEMYRQWGVALGGQIEPQAKFVVGGDVRESTPALLEGFLEGLSQAGVDPVNLGILPTPMIYYARRRLDAAACAIVTASHSPAEINGLKWLVGDRPPSQDQIRAMRQFAAGGEHSNGRTPLSPRTLDITFDYVAWLQETWMDVPPLARPIVLDPMHGSWASRARRYLQAVFPHSFFVAIRDQPDGSFGGQSPDCSRAEALDALSEEVYRQRAALGIAFDGDGDRVAFVDGEGNALTAEEATWLLLQSYGSELEGQTFVYDHKFSDRIPEAARRLGAVAVSQRSGHAFLRERMVAAGARFGAEVSGHYFFQELGGGDDGLFAACRMIAHVARSGGSLAELRREAPEVFVTPELRVPLRSRQHAEVIRHVRERFAEYPQTETGGLRVDFPEGWALIRSSVTESALTFRFEACDWDSLGRLVWQFCESLPQIGETLWTHYEDAAGLPGNASEE
jgi:phosphomannomutase